MSTRLIARLPIVGILVVLFACAGERSAEEGAMESVAMPDTTVEAVWAHVEEANYQENWELWPGKGQLYPGGVPHGMLLTTYVNGVAQEALAGTATSLPAGAIIVKENYMPDSTLAAVTVMYKTASFNSEHNNWFWIKRLADGTVQVGGRGEGCQNCHGARASNDYILTAPLGTN